MKFVKYSLIIGHWKGAPVKLHWTILPAAFFFSRSNFHPAYFLAFLLLIFIHEVGHAIVVRLNSFNVHEILVHGVGGSCGWSGYATEIQASFIAWGGIIAQLFFFSISVRNSLIFQRQHFWNNFFVYLSVPICM